MIELKQFQKKYKNNILYSPTDLVFPEHAISFLMGSNGCGKTTLLKCIAGLEDYKGEILFHNQPLRAVRSRCLVIWDDTPCFPNLTGIQNIRILSEIKGRPEILRAAAKYLDFAILKRKVKSYSYGQKKKLMLAVADLLQPDYLIMDEISNGLDIDMMDELAAHLNEMKAHTTIILTGHQFSFYEKVAEHIFIKRNDRVLHVSPEMRSSRTLEDIYHDQTIES